MTKRLLIYFSTLLLLQIIPLAHAAAPAIKTRHSERGEACVTLRNVARYYGLDYKTAKKNTIILQSKWSRLVFRENSRKCMYNGMLIWLNEPITTAGKRPAVHTSDLHMILDPLLRPDAHLSACGHEIILLDPGHGGRDSGARSSGGLTEKEAVLDIARRTRILLANAGAKAYLTREGDRYLPLNQRAEKARQVDADLFVSIHLNSGANRAASGVETFVLSIPGHQSTNDSKPDRQSNNENHAGNRNNKANTFLGYALHKRLQTELAANDRGIKRARFMVLKDAPCPAVLLECGFLSNPKEERLFQQSAYREKVARAISEGILDYLNAVRRSKILTD